VAEFTVLVLKIAFLAVLWLFIFLIGAVIHTDMVGSRQKKAKGPAMAGAGAGGGTGFPPPGPAARPVGQTPPVKRGKKEPWVLAIDSGLHAGDRLQLVPQVRIGRSDACELVLDDDFVSQTHALLSHGSDGRWVIKDLDSTNGTYVNTNRITTPTVVGVGDIIRIGGVQMRLEL